MGRLQDRIAVVTGAGRGIGREIALLMAAEGAKVVVNDLGANTDGTGATIIADEVVAEIKAAGGEAVSNTDSVADVAGGERLVQTAIDAFGGMDILVNNAAITYFIPVTDFPEKRFRLMMDVQVWAPFELAQRVLPGMQAQGSGWILNVSSHAAIHPQKDLAGRGGTVYGMCKAALERFTTGLAQETFGKGVGVNVISPGLVATPGVMHHKLINEENEDRVTPVEHMAEACLRLCYGDPAELTGRIDYADAVMQEFALHPAELI